MVTAEVKVQDAGLVAPKTRGKQVYYVALARIAGFSGNYDAVVVDPPVKKPQTSALRLLVGSEVNVSNDQSDCTEISHEGKPKEFNEELRGRVAELIENAGFEVRIIEPLIELNAVTDPHASMHDLVTAADAETVRLAQARPG